ncbi:glutathione S-transferase family protein [Actibacterium mucosum]|uniref:glutathione S-transferase family protein n=1 Tax=Actibacterium mucosum TaxID=1087332 RepID=UPI000556681E|nr:glutathione S-transferase family protein [Actibacterium mucosum]
MRYYFDSRSGSCRRVSAVAKHLGIDVEWVSVDLLAQESHTPEMLKLNPNGKLPVLVDGDLVLWEAAAIMIYLCDKAGDTTLWPEGEARHHVTKWMFWAAEHFRQSAPVYFEENFVTKLTGAAPDTTRVAYAEAELRRFAAILDAHLAENQFAAGDAPTLADFDLAAPLSQMPRSFVPYDDYPNIMDWYLRLGAAIPAWAETGAELDRRLNQLV